MNPIEIPVAALWGKLVAGGGCLLVGTAILWWTVPKFRLLLRVTTGREPRDPRTKTAHIVAGFIIYGFLFALVAVAGGILLHVTTTPPTVLSDSGISAGGGLVTARTTLEWQQINRVDCLARPDGTVRQLTVRAGERKIVISSLAMRDLSGVRELIRQRVPAEAVPPCWVLFRR